MTAPYFLVATEAVDSDTLVVGGAEGRHAVTVKRMQPGEAVIVGDGAGRVGHGVVLSVAGKDELIVSITSRSTVARSEPQVMVIQALPKGDRGETAVETMTEVGVDVIVPWAASRCITSWKGERAQRSLAKWRTTARESAKQSRRAYLPELAPLASTTEVAQLVSSAGIALVLHESGHLPIGSIDIPRAGTIVIVVGPEGGVTEAELAELTSAGGLATVMGPAVMRTSTAGTVAAGIVLAGTDRWLAR